MRRALHNLGNASCLYRSSQAAVARTHPFQVLDQSDASVPEIAVGMATSRHGRPERGCRTYDALAARSTERSLFLACLLRFSGSRRPDDAAEQERLKNTLHAFGCRRINRAICLSRAGTFSDFRMHDLRPWRARSSLNGVVEAQHEKTRSAPCRFRWNRHRRAPLTAPRVGTSKGTGVRARNFGEVRPTGRSVFHMPV